MLESWMVGRSRESMLYTQQHLKESSLHMRKGVCWFFVVVVACIFFPLNQNSTDCNKHS